MSKLELVWYLLFVTQKYHYLYLHILHRSSYSTINLKKNFLPQVFRRQLMSFFFSAICASRKCPLHLCTGARTQTEHHRPTCVVEGISVKTLGSWAKSHTEHPLDRWCHSVSHIRLILSFPPGLYLEYLAVTSFLAQSSLPRNSFFSGGLSNCCWDWPRISSALLQLPSEQHRSALARPNDCQDSSLPPRRHMLRHY